MKRTRSLKNGRSQLHGVEALRLRRGEADALEGHHAQPPVGEVLDDVPRVARRDGVRLDDMEKVRSMAMVLASRMARMGRFCRFDAFLAQAPT